MFFVFFFVFRVLSVFGLVFFVFCLCFSGVDLCVSRVLPDFGSAKVH